MRREDQINLVNDAMHMVQREEVWNSVCATVGKIRHGKRRQHGRQIHPRRKEQRQRQRQRQTKTMADTDKDKDAKTKTKVKTVPNTKTQKRQR